MGYILDWVSVAGLSKDEVLSRLGAEDTGEAGDWIGGADLAWAVTPDGRVVVTSDLFGWLEAGRLETLSRGASLVAASAEDNEMRAAAWGYEDGARVWSVVHDPAGSDDPMHLEVEGETPKVFAGIRKRLLADQAAETDPVDHLFDAPQDLAGALGGWRPEGDIGDDLEFTEARWIGRKPRLDAPSWRRPAAARPASRSASAGPSLARLAGGLIGLLRGKSR